MTLFPLIQLPEIRHETAVLPLFRETAWDFETNRPIWRGGEPVTVSGARAVLVWAWNTLHALRGMFDVFTRGYGFGIRALTGRSYTESVRRAEAVRYVREALLVNPYITGVGMVDVSFSGSALTVSCKIQSVYGEVSVNGCTL